MLVDDVAAFRETLTKAGRETALGRVSGLLFVRGDANGCIRVDVPSSITLIPTTADGSWWVVISKPKPKPKPLPPKK